MEAIKTIFAKQFSFPNEPEKPSLKGKINFSNLKGMEVKKKEDKGGFRYLLPDIGVEGYYVDNHENGKNRAIITLLSKSPEMLELLIKTKEELPADSQTRKEIEELLKELVD